MLSDELRLRSPRRDLRSAAEAEPHTLDPASPQPMTADGKGRLNDENAVPCCGTMRLEMQTLAVPPLVEDRGCFHPLLPPSPFPLNEPQTLPIT